MKALVLTPTRELANQVADELYSLKVEVDIECRLCMVGASIEQQIKKLEKRCEYSCGDAEKVMDLIDKVLKVNNQLFYVLDEADGNADMGFVEDRRDIATYQR